jgi:hypothetical protein
VSRHISFDRLHNGLGVGDQVIAALRERLLER